VPLSEGEGLGVRLAKDYARKFGLDIKERLK
jgi:hypothetical protein